MTFRFKLLALCGLLLCAMPAALAQQKPQLRYTIEDVGLAYRALESITPPISMPKGR
ncbi:MAG: hypothetical protein NT023_24760 [Armatimonadetes bacterium]|nr:hypothetical protein [Armatimonadota bacterium]